MSIRGRRRRRKWKLHSQFHIPAKWKPNSNRATAEGNRDPVLRAKMGFMSWRLEAKRLAGAGVGMFADTLSLSQ
jgi:hypothetical protein